MATTSGFWLSFAATVVLLVVSLVSGLARRRRVHLVTGPLTMVALAFAVHYTEQLVRAYTFPKGPMGIHLTCAITAGALALPVIGSGLLLAVRPQRRRLHRYCVLAFVGMTLVATSTGIWVFSIATAK
jgi:hypothetical protein